MERKLEDYFGAGVRMVWLVYPDRREVVIYSSPGDAVVRKGNDAIEGGTVLPGFTVTVNEIFSDLDSDSD